MKLEADQKNDIKSKISDIISDHAEKDFDHDKFFIYLFVLYEQSTTPEEFEDNCRKELVDFFGDNTENFLQETLKFFSVEDSNPKLENQHSRVSNNRNRAHGSNSDVDHLSDDLDDNFSNDDEDVDWRRRHKDSIDASSENPSLSKNPSEIRREKSGQKQPPTANPHNQINPNNQNRKTPPPQIQPTNKIPPHPFNPWPNPNPYAMYPMPYMPPSFPPMYQPPTMHPPTKPPKDDEYDPLKNKVQRDGPTQNRPNPENRTGVKRKNSRAEEESKISKVVVTDDGNSKQGQKVSTPTQDTNKSKAAIYIKNIPDYYNNIEALQKQFTKFGPIVNIKVELKQKMATIEFARPKFAKSALSNKPLFGNRDILVTDDPNMTLEDEANDRKKEQKLLDKLKFLIEVKRFLADSNKNFILEKINAIKQAQKTKDIGDSLASFVDEPNFDLTVDYSQAIDEVPANYIEQKVQLQTKLEAYGKLENFKLNPKTKVAEFKFFNLEHAKKAYDDLVATMKIRYVNEKIWEMIKKIKDFEEKFCSKTNGTS